MLHTSPQNSLRSTSSLLKVVWYKAKYDGTMITENFEAYLLKNISLIKVEEFTRTHTGGTHTYTNRNTPITSIRDPPGGVRRR